MSIKGLNYIFRSSIKTLRSEGFKDGTVQIFKGVRQEGGRTASIFCGIGFVTGCIAPAAIVSAPLLGYTGALFGKVLSSGVKGGINLTKKGLKAIV